MFAQARINGATSGRRANKASNHEKKFRDRSKLFHHQLEVKQDMAGNFLSPLAQKMAGVLLIIALRQFWTEECSLARKLCQRTGGHMSMTKIGRPV